MDVKTLTIDRSREWTVDDFLQLEESNTLVSYQWRTRYIAITITASSGCGQ